MILGFVCDGEVSDEAILGRIGDHWRDRWRAAKHWLANLGYHSQEGGDCMFAMPLFRHCHEIMGIFATCHAFWLQTDDMMIMFPWPEYLHGFSPSAGVDPFWPKLISWRTDEAPPHTYAVTTYTCMFFNKCSIRMLSIFTFAVVNIVVPTNR